MCAAELRSLRDIFVAELLCHNAGDNLAVRERMKYLDIPVDSKYCVLVAKPLFRDGETNMTELEKALTPMLPEAIFIKHPDGLVIVCFFKGEDRYEDGEQLKVWIHSIKKILKDHRAALGVSGEEFSMAKLESAYTCAFRSIEIGLRVQKNKRQWSAGLEPVKPLSDFNVFLYRDCEGYLLLEHVFISRAQILEQSRCISGLYEIRQNDASKKTNDLDLLRTYLFFDCSASKTAKAMYMHRNNVTYRIARIQNAFGFDIKDQQNRFLLTMGYYLIDLYGADCLDNLANPSACEAQKK